MFVDDRGAIEGSITGGCVEGALVQEAQRVLAGAPPKVATYGISDELAGDVGLTCGGIVHVLIHELDGDAAAVELAAHEAVAEGRPAAIATLASGSRAGTKLAPLDDGEVVGSLGGPALLDHNVARDVAALLEQGITTVRHYGADGDARCRAARARADIPAAPDDADLRREQHRVPRCAERSIPGAAATARSACPAGDGRRAARAASDCRTGAPPLPQARAQRSGVVQSRQDDHPQPDVRQAAMTSCSHQACFRPQPRCCASRGFEPLTFGSVDSS